MMRHEPTHAQPSEPAGARGTVDTPGFHDPQREAIRDDRGVVFIQAFGRWYGYNPASRLARSFRPAS